MTDKEKIEYKSSLKQRASDILHSRIEASSAAMKEAQLAANEGEKSSVGDKYETSRAMAQIDRDIHARQFESAQKDLTFIQQTDVRLFYKKIQSGAFVEASNGKYFFLTGLGPIEVNDERVIFVSINSPIGHEFSGKQSGDTVIFNGKEILVKDVF